MGEAATLADKKVLLVGASSGIGAAIAQSCVDLGAEVAVSARRKERLDELVADMGTGHAIAGDATDPDAARGVVSGAAEAMGGLDVIVYAAGIGKINRLSQFDAAAWRDVYEVNVIGANLVTAASLDVMDDDGIVAFISSRAAKDHNAHFGSYSVSKAALDQSIVQWRVEHPERRFIRVVMGNCAETEFGLGMGEVDDIEKTIGIWAGQGIPFAMMGLTEIGDMMAGSLALAAQHPGIDWSELELNGRGAAL